MINQIVTKNGVIEFKEKTPVNGVKTLNIVKATANLLDAKTVLDNHNVKFGLIYGTLLGAVREKGFIKHDEDIDLFVLDEERENVLSSLHDLIANGFDVIRYNDKLLSITRDNEYIDFYFFKKSNFLYRKCDVGLKAKAKYLENTIDYPFLGEVFQVPKNPEKFLVDLYGKNWRIPKKNDPSMNHDKYIIFRNSIKKNLPFIFSIISNIKKRLSWYNIKHN